MRLPQHAAKRQSRREKCAAHLRHRKERKGVIHLKDLKHLIYFEDLLENADNELVQKAKDEGKLAIG